MKHLDLDQVKLLDQLWLGAGGLLAGEGAGERTEDVYTGSTTVLYCLICSGRALPGSHSWHHALLLG